MYNWGLVSAGFLAAVLLLMLLFGRKWRDTRHLSGLHIFTAGLYGAVLILLLPLNYSGDVWQDPPLLRWIWALLFSILDAFKVFVLKGDFSALEAVLPVDGTLASQWLHGYAVILYFLAPLMSFSNVLVLFFSTVASLRLRFCGKRQVFVLSALNEASVVLAESIYKESRGKAWGRPLIVFAGKTGENDGGGLQQRAKGIGSILLKKAPDNLSIGKRSRLIEFFLIAEKEEDNIAQALSLKKRYRDGKHRVSVFVCASSDRADLMLDYQPDNKNFPDQALEAKVRDSVRDIAYRNVLECVDSELFGNFSMRRVDMIHGLVMDVLTRRDHGDYQAIYEAAVEDRTISILMLGMDRTGVEFLRTAVWFYQRYGYRVEFNVFCGGAEDCTEAQLRRSCPELFLNFTPTSGEACHDIRFFEGKDIASADFEELFYSDKETEGKRLGRTKLAFICLGSDERNVDTAISLRILFDRLRGETKANAGNQPIPYIYCVVRSDKQAESLSAGHGLQNWKGERLHIDFVGAFADQYSYERFRQIREKEKEAFPFHLDWVRKEAQLHMLYERAVREDTEAHFRQEIAEEMETGDFSWQDGSFFKDEACTDVDVEKLLKEVVKYMCYAYFRQSSIAKLEHKKTVGRFYPDAGSHGPVCNCDICREQRITEHMRWNAYMRAAGYRYGKNRFDRAKVHNDLKPWDQLPCRERYKD